MFMPFPIHINDKQPASKLFCQFHYDEVATMFGIKTASRKKC